MGLTGGNVSNSNSKILPYEPLPNNGSLTRDLATNLAIWPLDGVIVHPMNNYLLYLSLPMLIKLSPILNSNWVLMPTYSKLMDSKEMSTLGVSEIYLTDN